MEEKQNRSPFAAALSYFLGKKWGAGSALARAIGKSSGYVSELGSGKKKGEEDVRRVIASYFGVAYDEFIHLGRWILDGNDPEEWKPPLRGHLVESLQFVPASGITSNISRPPTPSRHPHSIPVISWVQAGEWSEVSDPFQPGFAEEWIDTTETNNPNAFALAVHGDSMEPEFAEGDIVTVDPCRAYCSGSYVIVKNGDEATFKQLILDGSSVFLKPLNSRYPIKDMTGIEFRIVGVVVEKRKRY